MMNMERDFADLANSKRQVDKNWEIEKDASKAKDEIIKSQDDKILKLEVSSHSNYLTYSQ